ncbi:primosome, DnaD subunit [Dehalogenimonas lykanthroporepellens BL-DC-9]|jgi:DnaD/phage-associated family protein|nr:primosome, DnaD subunit [Dehalogenimonas lykanthroporepellens BL-DC-9]
MAFCYPDRLEFFGIPKYFLSVVMPEIDDINELKATILFFQLYYSKKTARRYVTDYELTSFKELGLTLEQVRTVMGRSSTSKHIIKIHRPNNAEIYILNDKEGQTTAQYILQHKILIPNVEESQALGGSPIEDDFEIASVFHLYEENIGLLTPIIADEIKTALTLYPVSWIKEAISESAKMNKRNWRYISKILDNWLSQGKNDGTYREDNKEQSKYLKGAYGKHVQR